MTAVPPPAEGPQEHTCTGCGASITVAIRAVLAGQVACCPDCSTLTVGERNALRLASLGSSAPDEGPH